VRRFRELPPCVLTGCGPVQEATPVQLTHVDASGRAAMVDVGQARPLLSPALADFGVCSTTVAVITSV